LSLWYSLPTHDTHQFFFFQIYCLVNSLVLIGALFVESVWLNDPIMRKFRNQCAMLFILINFKYYHAHVICMDVGAHGHQNHVFYVHSCRVVTLIISFLAEHFNCSITRCIEEINWGQVCVSFLHYFFFLEHTSKRVSLYIRRKPSRRRKHYKVVAKLRRNSQKVKESCTRLTLLSLRVLFLH
jgi:hypothetical protein